MKGTIRIIVWALSGLLALPVSAQQAATVRIDAGVKHQHITGFGGFVCSPRRMQYNASVHTYRKRKLVAVIGDGQEGQADGPYSVCFTMGTTL